MGSTLHADGHNSTLIKHWGGTAWQQIPSPGPGLNDTELSSVQSVSANDAWAVGNIDNAPLLLRWDGLS